MSAETDDSQIVDMASEESFPASDPQALEASSAASGALMAVEHEIGSKLLAIGAELRKNSTTPLKSRPTSRAT
jgi:hypothetical protein